MKSVLSTVLCGVFSLALVIGSAPARDWECPGATNNDACDQMIFERADRELAKALERKSAKLGARTTDMPGADAARSLILAAQRQWTLYRDAECAASVAANFVSARTKEGLMAACLLEMTAKRIAEVDAD